MITSEAKKGCLQKITDSGENYLVIYMGKEGIGEWLKGKIDTRISTIKNQFIHFLGIHLKMG